MESDGGGCLRYVFRSFVCVSLTILLGLQVYGYLWANPTGLDGDFSDVKYVVMQLSRGLSEVFISILYKLVNRKHEHLKSEMERITSALPAVAAAAGRAKDALQPSRHTRHAIVELHDYDRQIADFALESAGARIVDTGDTIEHILYESPVSYGLHLLASWMCRGHECLNARAILRPGALPGECWAFRGGRGEAVIRLLGTVIISGVSLEHIPAHIAPTREISSAPRLFQIEGLECRTDQYPHDFGTFEYDNDGKPIQYFEVRNPAARGYNLVRLRVLSNWGHPVYTCVYRIRVHGELAAGQVPQSTDDEMRIDNE